MTRGAAAALPLKAPHSLTHRSRPRPDSKLADVDWLHGAAEFLLTVSNVLVVLGLRSALLDDAQVWAQRTRRTATDCPPRPPPRQTAPGSRTSPPPFKPLLELFGCLGSGGNALPLLLSLSSLLNLRRLSPAHASPPRPLAPSPPPPLLPPLQGPSVKGDPLAAPADGEAYDRGTLPLRAGAWGLALVVAAFCASGVGALGLGPHDAFLGG